VTKTFFADDRHHSLIVKRAESAAQHGAEHLRLFHVEALPRSLFAQVQTETFTVLAVCQWFNVLNCRSETKWFASRSLRAALIQCWSGGRHQETSDPALHRLISHH
jgi:hypothetical protein